jgi:PAS domain S-box-containing protein
MAHLPAIAILSAVLSKRALTVAVCFAALGTVARGASADTLSAAPAPARRTVVVLYSFSLDTAGAREASQALEAGLQQPEGAPVDVYTEYTGLDRFSGKTYEDSLLALYNEKYKPRSVDLLIVVGPTALDFVVAHKFLPDVPLVTCYVPRRFVDEAQKQRPEITGALHTQTVVQSAELWLSRFPATKRILVVLGASEYERAQAQIGKSIMFKPLEGRVEFEYLNDLTLEQIEARVAAAPDTDLVLWGSLLRDAAGRDFVGNAGLRRVSRASRRPLIGSIAEDLGDGITGGVLLSLELSGRATAQLGRRILDGEKASAIPLVPDAGVATIFDWRELKRFGIRESSLPPGSVVKFRELSVWDQYWKEISAAAALIVIESLLVAGLIWQLSVRHRVERKLLDAERRYRTVADFTHDWEYWRRADGAFEYISPACERIVGYTATEITANPAMIEERIVEEDHSRWKEHQTRGLAGSAQGPVEFRFRRRDGEVRWLEQIWNPVRFSDGTFGGTRGRISDITDRKQAELDLKTAYVQIAALKDQLEAENTYYRDRIQSVEGSSELIGGSDQIKYLLFRIGQVAPSQTTVLIQGETGTGKELVAEEIHRRGPRKDRPLIKINCAALPGSLAESELFGHERGAFTGAQAQRKGRFELADGATLFLDEVGELTAEVQAKLLRVLQDGTFQRVGGDKTLKVDVRVIAATNRDLQKEVAGGRFREDLWYRLNVFPITVPPLRNRKEDIAVLAAAFVDRACEKMGRERLGLPRAVVQALEAYSWPGNVRELQNVIEQAVLVSEGTLLRLADALRAPAAQTDGGAAGTLVDIERSHIIKVLEQCGWKIEGKDGAAAILGLKPSTLRSRLAKLQISRV